MAETAGGAALAAVKRMGLIVLWTVLVFVVLWLGYLYVGQERLIYYPRAYSPGELKEAADVAVTLEYETAQGKQAAFYVRPGGAGPGDPAPGRLWIVCGGNAMTALDWLGMLPAFESTQSGYLLIDYPGYGSCEGKPSPGSIDESVTMALSACAAHLGMTREAFCERGAVLGVSIGSAVALKAAEGNGIGKVVLLAPFTSMVDMAAKLVGRPLSGVVRHRFDNRAPVRKLLERGAEVTIIHGEEDEIIPVEMGRELADIDPDRITFHAVPGAGHNDLLAVGFPVIREAMK